MENPREIKIEDFNYPLPDERIARHPLSERDACKLLVTDGETVEDHIFNELPTLLPEGAMMVCNNTRVINARLRFQKATGALIEIFCLEPTSQPTTPRLLPQGDTANGSALSGTPNDGKRAPST